MSKQNKMLKFHAFISFLLFAHFIFISADDKFVGPGTWVVKHIMKCENDDQYPMKLDLTRRPINRTHEGFDAVFKVPYVIDDVAIQIIACKYVDGGCKPFQTLGDQSLQNMCKKYAEENTKAMLAGAGINPPEFPLPPGRYEMKQFIFNYDELPETATYGKFNGKIYLVKDLQNIACVQLDAEFNETGEE